MSEATVIELRPELAPVVEPGERWTEADKQRYWAELARLAAEQERLAQDEPEDGS